MLRSSPIAVYEHGLRRRSVAVVDEDGTICDLPVGVWRGVVGEGDQALLSRCHGPTLDVGCGPGRITAALARSGTVALGVDVSALAVAMTRARGGSALRRDIFALGIGRRRWSHVILADGNVGIGGNPIRLLWRCRTLLAARGTVLVDLDPPGQGMRQAAVRLVSGTRASDWFDWAWLAADAIEPIASAAGLSVLDVWQSGGDAGRWQAELGCANTWPAPAGA